MVARRQSVVRQYETIFFSLFRSDSRTFRSVSSSSSSFPRSFSMKYWFVITSCPP